MKNPACSGQARVRWMGFLRETKPENAVQIGVSNRNRREAVRIGTFRTLARNVLLRSGRKRAELSLTFVDDRLIRGLNRKYRRKDRATDVLAFDLSRPARAGVRRPPLTAEIVISTQTARRQAAEKGHSLKREISILLIHGLLHVLGYDHQRKKQAGRMARRERFLFKEYVR